MDFFKILNTFATILAWLIIIIVLWAAFPYFSQLLQLAKSIHDFGAK